MKTNDFLFCVFKVCVVSRLSFAIFGDVGQNERGDFELSKIINIFQIIHWIKMAIEVTDVNKAMTSLEGRPINKWPLSPETNF